MPEPCWPADGLPLADAFWRVVGERAARAFAPPLSAESNPAIPPLPLVELFIGIVSQGHYRAHGRRGSPTAALTDIPPGAWQYLNLIGYVQNVVAEATGWSRLAPIKPDAVVWYDVHIRQPETTATPESIPERPTVDPFRSGGPGRPSATEIVVKEGKRRIEAGDVVPTQGGLTEFAITLSTWWQTKQRGYDPPAPNVSWKTIANGLREFWNSKV
jgi:hypothetical protein